MTGFIPASSSKRKASSSLSNHACTRSAGCFFLENIEFTTLTTNKCGAKLNSFVVRTGLTPAANILKTSFTISLSNSNSHNQVTMILDKTHERFALILMRFGQSLLVSILWRDFLPIKSIVLTNLD